MAEITGNFSVGRGMKFPFQLSGGGCAYNMPKVPTLDEALAAATGAIHMAVTTPRGSCFMNRGFGTEADSLVFAQATNATADVLAREVVATIGRSVPYVTLTSVVAAPVRDAIAIEIRYGLVGATREAVSQALIPARS